MYNGEYEANFFEAPKKVNTHRVTALYECPKVITNNVTQDDLLSRAIDQVSYEILKSKKYNVKTTKQPHTQTTIVELSIDVAEPRIKDAYADREVCMAGDAEFSMSEVREALECTFPERFI